MAQKPSIPKGTRDFNPTEVSRREYIISTIKKHFQTYGFMPIETPSFENSETLLGKYGEEGDRLIFKILNNGEYIENYQNLIKSFFYEFLKGLVMYHASGEVNYGEFIRSTYSGLGLISIISTIKDQRFNSEPARNIIDNNFLESLNSIIDSSNEIIIDISFEQLESNDLDDLLEKNKAIVQKLAEDCLKEYLIKANSSKTTNFISDRALRYDLTVPFARYVVQHQNEIAFPFKRYQVQNVWRADRPQKGRFREFTQCDADVVGSDSLLQEVEFIKLFDDVYTDLGLKGCTIKINNRKVLAGIAQMMGAEDKLIDFTVALDKLDKIGADKVKQEMLDKGIDPQAIEKLQPVFELDGSFEEKIGQMKNLLASSNIGLQGIAELEFIKENLVGLELKTTHLDLDITLARGLNYYTGCIFEVAAPAGVSMGSISGGGRYDDLTGIFGMKDMSGVGISFGLDRIYLVLEELNLFPETVKAGVQVLYINFGEVEASYCMKLMFRFRESGIKTELYPDSGKMKKQMTYADKNDIPFVILAGEDEIKSGQLTLKNMKTGEQNQLTADELIQRFKSGLF